MSAVEFAHRPFLEERTDRSGWFLTVTVGSALRGRLLRVATARGIGPARAVKNAVHEWCERNEPEAVSDRVVSDC